jgi:hypothetical protein
LLIQDSQAFTASQTIDDILVNNVLASNFRQRYAVTYGFTASATGLRLDLKVGLNFVTVNIRPSTQNRFPIFPDDQLGTFGVVPGDRIILTGRDTTGGAQTLFYAFRFRPV